MVYFKNKQTKKKKRSLECLTSCISQTHEIYSMEHEAYRRELKKAQLGTEGCQTMQSLS